MQLGLAELELGAHNILFHLKIKYKSIKNYFGLYWGGMMEMQLSLIMCLPSFLHFHSTIKNGSSRHNIYLAPSGVFTSSGLSTTVIILRGQLSVMQAQSFPSSVILIKSIVH